MSPLREFLNTQDAVIGCGVVLILASVVGAFIGNKEAVALLPIGVGMLTKPRSTAP